MQQHTCYCCPACWGPQLCGRPASHEKHAVHIKGMGLHLQSHVSRPHTSSILEVSLHLHGDAGDIECHVQDNSASLHSIGVAA